MFKHVMSSLFNGGPDLQSNYFTVEINKIDISLGQKKSEITA